MSKVARLSYCVHTGTISPHLASEFESHARDRYTRKKVKLECRDCFKCGLTTTRVDSINWIARCIEILVQR